MDDKEQVVVLSLVMEIVPYIIILVVVLTIRAFILTPIKVNGESMVPTLDGGELMILTKYNKNNLNRYDIVVVDARDSGLDEDIIKRVIALPGETISCESGIIYINGKKIKEKYVKGVPNDFKKVKLNKDEYFVLGDNRVYSHDSSEFGAIKKSQIKGKANLVLFPFDEFGIVK